MKRVAILTTLFLLASCTEPASAPPQDTTHQAERLPIIDMHLHAFVANWMGPPPVPVCSGNLLFLGWDPKEPLTLDMLNECPSPVLSATTDEELMERTLAIMTSYNVVKAVTSGPQIDEWKAAAPDRIMAGLAVGSVFGDGFTADTNTGTLRSLLSDKRYEVIGEFAPQYDGMRPGDAQLDPYFAVAEELDIPIGIHVGLGPPGAAYLGGIPNYRMGLSNPLLLEEVLLKYPKLRLYVMHAGWPMLDQMIGLLYAHPQVYVDVSNINWYVPRSEFHAYLQRLVEAGFAKRIMFGSDQMLWPEAVGWGVEAIEAAGFLTAEQKRDIFYNNAARFLRLTEEQIAAHHGK